MKTYDFQMANAGTTYAKVRPIALVIWKYIPKDCAIAVSTTGII